MAIYGRHATPKHAPITPKYTKKVCPEDKSKQRWCIQMQADFVGAAMDGLFFKGP
jgi:hypothetical protein